MEGAAPHDHNISVETLFAKKSFLTGDPGGKKNHVVAAGDRDSDFFRRLTD
jgi:hypothetical protein